jgi:hypothetical protein
MKVKGATAGTLKENLLPYGSGHPKLKVLLLPVHTIWENCMWIIRVLFIFA